MAKASRWLRGAGGEGGQGCLPREVACELEVERSYAVCMGDMVGR